MDGILFYHGSTSWLTSDITTLYILMPEMDSIDSRTFGLKRGMLLPAYRNVVLRRSSGSILVMLEC
jgi:hypothetical protein